jgi:hypothetical protein
LFWGKDSPEVALMYEHLVDSLRGQAGEICVELSGSACSEDFIEEIAEMIDFDMLHSIDLDEYDELTGGDSDACEAAGIDSTGWPERDDLVAPWLELGLVPIGIVTAPTPVRGVMLYALVDEDGETLEWIVNDES